MTQGSHEAEEETDATSAALRQSQAGQRSRVLRLLPLWRAQLASRAQAARSLPPQPRLCHSP